MIIKKYVVDELRDAMPMIKRDLGQDAVILNTKTIKVNRFLWFMKKEKLEVIAAIDPKEELKVHQVKKQKELKEEVKQPAPEAPKANEQEKRAQKLEKELLGEIKHLKAFMLQALDGDKLPEPLTPLNQLLVQQGINNDVRAYFISRMLMKISQNPSASAKDVINWAKEEMLYDLEAFQAEQISYPKRITCFLGPTGVGKTTTIAKLAGHLILHEGKKVGFITADTYRIAAVEQLQTYAEILGSQIEIASSPDELTVALENLKSCDVILMDTAGRNYTEQEYINELESLLQSDIEIHKNLVLSLTSKSEDMAKIIDQFQALPIDEIILTKKDETETYGTIVNLMYKHSTSIRYITNGQNVPDDIVEITPDVIINYIFGEDAND